MLVSFMVIWKNESYTTSHKTFFFIIIQLAASLKMHYYVVWAVSFTEAKKRTFA